MNSIAHLFILFIVLMVLGFLYKKYEDKRLREEDKNNYEAIQQYLLDDVTLGKSKKPILWIHVPYEYNSRNWLNFGSRSSLDLNQPYLYLTVKSIISHCDNSFTVCIIDDNSFQKLIPNWNINMTTVSGPILNNIRTLGLMKLLYKYGGLMCPISFLCTKDLHSLYINGTHDDKMFVCETNNRNMSSSENNFLSNISFSGAPKECQTVLELCEFIQHTISQDTTAESVFLGSFNNWCEKCVKSGKINKIDGEVIGIKTTEGKQIVIENLLSNYYLDLYKDTYGILIPADELLKRRKFEWFTRMSAKQVLESDTIIGNYLLLANSTEKFSTIEKNDEINNKNIEIKNEFVGFWKTPNYPGIYGLKPNYLGNNMEKLDYVGQ